MATLSKATLKQRIIGRAIALTMPRALSCLNYRILHADRSVDPARPEYDEHVIHVFWHEFISVILPRWGHTPLSILCSHHRDGELVNQTALALGLHVVRGSSNRGGATAIRQLRNQSKFSSLAVTPDGPRGPRREMAMGPIYLASLLKIPIVPLGVGISNPYRLDTWDQFAIPRPLSKVRIVFGKKIRIGRKLEREEWESWRLRVQQEMNDLTDQAQQWADSGGVIEGQQPFFRARRTNTLYFDQADSVGSAASPRLRDVA